MKFLYILPMICCAVYGFRFKDLLSNHIDVSPHNQCAGQPDGMRLPHPSNCQQFILCDGQVGLTLSCRASEPHFNRCNQRCVNDINACTADCNGGGEVTPPPTQTTTRFVPPTVPVRCPIPCENVPNTCECDERWTCISGKCQCDTNIQCPMTKEDCLAKAGCGGSNGCAERCDCIDDNNCLCNMDVECGFAETECAKRCGCAGNCNCDGDPRTCVCNEVCSCIQPPLVCPFAPSDCIQRCECQQRCLCNGNVCTCDLVNGCPAHDILMMRY